jgi:hypothetical protein
MDPVSYPDHDSGARRLGTEVAGNIGFAMVLALAALLRVWHLNQAGLGTQYYAAGVLSMLESWHNFFFNDLRPDATPTAVAPEGSRQEPAQADSSASTGSLASGH